jgi:hypothetical protein
MLGLKCALVVLVLSGCVLFASAPTDARAQGAPADTGYWVTIAARVCPSYTDISANKARNNIMESLRDLGPDTPYVDALASSLVDPTIEQLSQPNCKALPGWRFRLGTGIAPNRVVGTWGSLSVVNEP